MARLAASSVLEDSDDDSRVGTTGSHARSERPSLSPTTSVSSDKENRQASTSLSASTRGKRGSADMPPPERSNVSTASASSASRNNKRRRLGGLERQNVNRAASQAENDQEEIDTKYYDPDQNPEERRAVRRGLRTLARDLNDNRVEYLAPGNTGLLDTVKKANALMENVKQTSDATIDSRLLVVTGDLSYKKTVQMTLGDAAAGIDVDDFVSKCIRFMRRGPDGNDELPAGSSTQARRRRVAVADEADEDDEEAVETGDAMNWKWLGREACFPFNARPPVPGFLLGPLSVQMRARKERAKRTGLQRRNQGPEVRPEELQKEDLERAENSNLTTICVNIRNLLLKLQDHRNTLAEQEMNEHDDREWEKVAEKHGLADDGGLPFFKFVINPRSFGQTVENLFYVSFLVRDGAVKVGKDSNGLPTLGVADALTSNEIREQGVERYQAVFSLDWPTWQDLIEVFDIDDSLIPDRTSTSGTQVTGRGWYG